MKRTVTEGISTRQRQKRLGEGITHQTNAKSLTRETAALALGEAALSRNGSVIF